jgi:heterodisulfide reductase subunit C
VDALPITRRIRYQKDLDPDFAKTILARPGGEDLLRCIQCGTCSATCPASVYMDYSPRRIIAMVRAGMRDDVLSSNAIWLCSSCYACTVECPKQIKITDVMYALKQIAVAAGTHPRRLPIPVLARESQAAVRRNGRISEGQVAARTFLKSDPRKLIGQATLGLRLMSRGRLTMRTEAMDEGREQVRRLLDRVEQAEQPEPASTPGTGGH